MTWQISQSQSGLSDFMELETHEPATSARDSERPEGDSPARSGLVYVSTPMQVRQESQKISEIACQKPDRREFSLSEQRK
jgi:hypothetical protein